MKELNGVVLKQWALSGFEVLKSAFYSALLIVAVRVEALFEQVVSPDGVVQWPSTAEIITLAKYFVSAFVIFLFRYWVKPTTTVVKGEIEHKEPVVVNTKKELNPDVKP